MIAPTPIAIEAPELIGIWMAFPIAQTEIETAIVCQISNIVDQMIRAAINC